MCDTFHSQGYKFRLWCLLANCQEYLSTPHSFLIARIISRVSPLIHNFVAPIWKTTALIVFHATIISAGRTETVYKGTLAARRSLPSWTLTTKPAPPLLDEETTEPSKLTLSHLGGGACQATKRGELLGSYTHFKWSQFTHGCSIAHFTIFHLSKAAANCDVWPPNFIFIPLRLSDLRSSSF